MMKFVRIKRAMALLCLIYGCFLYSQNAEIDLKGTVLDQNGNPVSGVTLTLSNLHTVTDQQGRYHLKGYASDTSSIVLSYFGTQLLSKKLSTDMDGVFKLNVTPHLEQGLIVTTSRTGSISETILPERVIRETPAPVTGEMLRVLPGVGAVRRGSVGLDPVVQGLRETQIGQYFDGTRMFAAGPGRMDSGLSHVDPSAVHKVQVVKGPYALTWGAGNLSAIRLTTRDLTHIPSGFHGNLLAGYHGNTEAAYTSAALFGRQGQTTWWIHGVTREADDYESGDGIIIPGKMSSTEFRGKLRFDLNTNTNITLLAGVQDQGDLDYPGRLLDARFFKTGNYALRYEANDISDRVKSLSAQVYFNTVEHEMDNDDKPTAQANPNRRPPFPLEVFVDTQSDTSGGNVALNIDTGENFDLEVGADFYLSERDATRFISRRDSGMTMFVDKMWPEAEISDLGIFGRVAWPFGDILTGEATLRLDLIDASAGQVSEFFAANAGTDTDAEEANLSGAVTLSAGLGGSWILSAGLGSVVRSADATERYSDRIPTAKAQISAEFMGNPQLDPERANQFDLWLEGAFNRAAVSFNAFHRRIDDYITLEATDLPKRLPLSPPTVFRYINGEAEFTGFDASLSAELNEAFKLSLHAGYLDGKDLEVDEPAFGVAPFQTDLRLRYNSQRNFFLEGSVHYDAKQDEISFTRNEAVTNDYTTLDLLAGYTFRGLTLQFGARNLTDEEYVNHLNARNPFTGKPLPEPGRIVHFTARYAF